MLLSSVRSQNLYSVSKICIFYFPICLNILSSFSSLWLSKIRGDRMQPVEFLASKSIPENQSKQGSDPIISTSHGIGRQSRNVGYFLKLLIGKWIRSLKALFSISVHNCNSITAPSNSSLVRGSPITQHCKRTYQEFSYKCYLCFLLPRCCPANKVLSGGVGRDDF